MVLGEYQQANWVPHPFNYYSSISKCLLAFECDVALEQKEKFGILQSIGNIL